MNKENEITIAKFLLLFKQNLKIYGFIVLLCFVFGVIVSISIPKSYTAKITLAPETSTSGLLNGNLSTLSSLVGMNGLGNSSDAIFPEIYPDVVSSTKFIVELSKIHIKTMDGKISTTLYDYIENEQKSPWWEISQYFGKKKRTEKKLDSFLLNKEQTGVIKAIGQSISCSVNKNNGVITIKATAQDALVSAILVDSVSSMLQNFITDYRTNKARNDLAHINKMYQEAKKNYEQARQLYSTFADANEGLVLQSYKSKENDLENEMQLRYNIYTQVTAQLQMAKAKVIEKTPVYAILQPATVPIRQSSPKKMLITLGFVIVGCMTYTAYVMLKK